MSLLYFLEGIRTPILDKIMSYITLLGDETAFLVVAIIVFWCIDKRHGYYMMTVGFLGTTLNLFLKMVFRIPRPWVKDPNFTIVESARAGAEDYSFPSGHAQSSVTVFGTIARRTNNKVIRWVSAVLILLVCFSRMYLGVHTPLDVGASVILGLILVFAFYPIFKDKEPEPKKMYALIIAMLIIAVGYVLFTELYPFPADADPVFIKNDTSHGYKLVGAVVGLLFAYTLDIKYIHFDTKAVFWVQAVKCIVGFALLLAIKELLKAPLNALLPENAANCVRYFAVVFFAAALWPMTFKRLSGLSRKSTR